MRACLLLSLIAAMGLAACATPPAPARNAAMAWSLAQVEGEGAKLTYGRPNSDDVLIMLTCEPRSNRVRIATTAQVVHADIDLGSGAAAKRYPAEASPAGFDGGYMLESTAAPSDPVLAHFAQRGELALTVDGHRYPIARADAGLARRFLQSCSG